MMTWNYRVIHQVINEDDIFDVHEVFYSEEGRPELVTENSVGPMGETREELWGDLMMMMEAFAKPVLEYDSFEEPRISQ